MGSLGLLKLWTKLFASESSTCLLPLLQWHLFPPLGNAPCSSALSRADSWSCLFNGYDFSTWVSNILGLIFFFIFMIIRTLPIRSRAGNGGRGRGHQEE